MKIGVVGSGTMGNGIAHSFAMNNFKVALYDINEEMLNNGLLTISNNLDRQISKGVILNEEKLSILGNISTSMSIESLHDSSIIIEAATENFKIKTSIFNQLDTIANKDCILASNTSSISILKIANNTGVVKNWVLKYAISGEFS